MAPNLLYRHDRWLAIVVLVLAATVVLLVRPTENMLYSPEASQRVEIARDVTARAHDLDLDQSRGNQALVGSLLLAPLPTVLLALAGLLPGVHVTAALSSAVSAFAFALFAAYVYHYWRRQGVSGAIALPAALAMVLFPPVAHYIWRGSSGLLFIALAVTGLVALVEWLRSGTLHDLAYAAVFLGLSCGVRYQGLFLALGGLLFVAARCAIRWRGWNRLEGTAITYALPIGYVVLLWIGGNWLILGQPFYFMSGTLDRLATGTMTPGSLLRWDCPWALTGLFAGIVLMVPFAAAFSRDRIAGPVRQVGAALGLAALLVLSLSLPTTRPEQAVMADRERAADAVNTLEQRYRNTVFIVTGYAGYTFTEVAGDDPEHRWIHYMRIQDDVGPTIDNVLANYPGRNVALLVDSAEGQNPWIDDSSTWLSPDRPIPDRFIYRDRVGRWTVFEVVRTDTG